MEEKLKTILQELGNKFPRNIVEICNKMGIEVQETEQFPANVSGLIYKKDEKYTILVNAFHTIGRKSFTIAHELGHYIKHKKFLDECSEMVSYIKSKDDNSVVPTLTRCEEHYDKYETEANSFAADVLMPQDEFLKVCNNANSIEEVAAHFGVSIQAATIRAQKTGGLFFL